MKKMLFLLLIHGVASASPFCGFYIGGGLGWDFFYTDGKRLNVVRDEQPFRLTSGDANGFRGEGFVGWMGSCGAAHYGARIGYQGFVDDRVRNMPLVGTAVSDLWKVQGAFLDVTPGWQFCRCWLVHLLFGVGQTQYHLFARHPDSGLVLRDATEWSFLPRLGAGLQWDFGRCLTAGFEWSYNFPGRPVWPHLPGAPTPAGENIRWEKVRSNQFAFTLNWYFL